MEERGGIKKAAVVLRLKIILYLKLYQIQTKLLNLTLNMNFIHLLLEAQDVMLIIT